MTFYDLIEAVPARLRRHRVPLRGRATRSRERLGRRAPAACEVRCLGHCYAAPVVPSGDAVFARPAARESVERLARRRGARPVARAGPRTRSRAAPRRVAGGAAPPARERAAAATSSEYDLPAGETILRRDRGAGLRGRGGAAYPDRRQVAGRARHAPARRARTWSRTATRATRARSWTGCCSRRIRTRSSPGMLACARVIGARRGIVFVRGEYPRAQRVMRDGDRARRARRRARRASSTSRWSRAPARTCAARRPRCCARSRGCAASRAQAAVPGRARAVGPARPWCRTSRRWRSCRGSCATRAPTGTKAVCLSGAVARAGRRRDPARHAAAPRARAGGRRAARRAALAHGADRRPDGARAAGARFDAPLSYEALPGMRPRRHRGARRERHAARAGRAPVRLRARRVVRQLHAVPRRHRAARTRCASARRSSACSTRSRSGACAASARACRGRSATCSSTSATRCSRDARSTDGAVAARGTRARRLPRARARAVPAFCHDDRARRPAATAARAWSRWTAVGRRVHDAGARRRDGASPTAQRLREYRRDLGELMAVRERAARRGRRASLAGVGRRRRRYGRADARAARRDASHPYLRLDLDALHPVPPLRARVRGDPGPVRLRDRGPRRATRASRGARARSPTAACVVVRRVRHARARPARSRDVDRAARRAPRRAAHGRVVRTPAATAASAASSTCTPPATTILRIDGAPARR